MSGHRAEASGPGAAARLFTALVAAETAEGADRGDILDAAEHRIGMEVLSGPLLPWRKVELARAATVSGRTRLAAALITSMRSDAGGASGWVESCALWMQALSAARAGSRDRAGGLYALADEVAVAFEAT
ncbi:hypothetical protein G3M53_39655, partial [Streptomyces sp. SID7982]|nr:hypothetical protein [Streptomyces sp. SID7982]